MKHSYTVLLVIMLAVIAISVFFPHSRYVEGFEDPIDSVEKGVVDAKDHVDGGHTKDHTEDHDEHDDDEPAGYDSTQHCPSYESEDKCPETVCAWKKSKDANTVDMDTLKAGNTVEDHDTTETFANWSTAY